MTDEFKAGDEIKFTESPYNSDRVYRVEEYGPRWVAISTPSTINACERFNYSLSVEQFEEIKPVKVTS